MLTYNNVVTDADISTGQEVQSLPSSKWTGKVIEQEKKLNCVEQIVDGTDEANFQRVESATKLPLHYDGVQSHSEKAFVILRKLYHTHGLGHHPSDDLLFHSGEKLHIFTPHWHATVGDTQRGSQQFFLIVQCKQVGIIRLFRQICPTRYSSLDQRDKLGFYRCQGHTYLQRLFLLFFDDIGNEKRCGADGCAQRVVNYVVCFRHAEAESVLGILDPSAQKASKDSCNGNACPVVELSWKHIRECQPEGEEEEDVHERRAIGFRLDFRNC